MGTVSRKVLGVFLLGYIWVIFIAILGIMYSTGCRLGMPWKIRRLPKQHYYLLACKIFKFFF